jgi:hypothetical protein
MTADDSDSWLDLQVRRRERMRYEVLRMVREAARGVVGIECSTHGFTRALGVWSDEFAATVEWLASRGLLECSEESGTLALTHKGWDYLENNAGRRLSVRDEDV